MCYGPCFAYFTPLPSPFEPPRNATSPAHAHFDCWWPLFPGSGGWSGRRVGGGGGGARGSQSACWSGGQALRRTGEVFFSEVAGRAGG